MPSKGLGRLLSSSASRSCSYDDDIPRSKSRFRALSDNPRQGSGQKATDCLGQYQLGLETTDSNFAGLDKRALFNIDADIGLNETDDFGFPLQPSDEIDHSSKETDQCVAGRCRICDTRYHISLDSNARCEQCLAFLGEQPQRQYNAPECNASYARAREIVDSAIADGLRRLSKHDGIQVDHSLSHRKSSAERLLSPQRRSASHDKGSVYRRNSNRANAKHELTTSGRLEKLNEAGRYSVVGAWSQDKRNMSLHLVQQDARSSVPKRASPPCLDAEACPTGYADLSHAIRLGHLETVDKTVLLRAVFRPIYMLMAQTLERTALNAAFSTLRDRATFSDGTEGDNRCVNDSSHISGLPTSQMPPELLDVDHKNLMVGDVYDVATSLVTDVSSSRKQQSSGRLRRAGRLVSQTSAHIDWTSLQKWYRVFTDIGLPIRPRPKASTINDSGSPAKSDGRDRTQIIEELGLDVRATMLRMVEKMLTVPQPRHQQPEDTRYLLMLLANPMLLQPRQYPTRMPRRSRSAMQLNHSFVADDAPSTRKVKRRSKLALPSMSFASRVLSMLVGTLANLPAECVTYIPGWLARFPELQFRAHIDALLAFIDDRLAMLWRRAQKSCRKYENMTHKRAASSMIFSEILGSHYKTEPENSSHDWQLRSACTVLRMFVQANAKFILKSSSALRAKDNDDIPRRRPGTTQLLPTEHFYLSRISTEDKFDARKDFDDWEREHSAVQLCQFPFLLPLETKTVILEHDARRKMDIKARQEFLESLSNRVIVNKNFHLNIRRDCIVEDSLQRISDAVSAAEGEAKKALKVHFEGEDGIDAGGLRKEWFLLLIRELLNPDAGLFIYNEESNYCYFNPLSFESTEQYQLVGAVLGLAIYNFTILDIPFPPFLFRKLADAAPTTKGPDGQRLWKPSWKVGLSDLAQLDPTLARNLQYILDYEGDLAEEICATFDVEISHHGILQSTSLHPGEGEKVVDRDNRDEYVRQYIDYVLNKAIRKQFEAFARGFFSVCWGNALSLFRGEEVELLIRGSSNLDFGLLRESAVYENWRISDDGPELTDRATVQQSFPVVNWFWELMQHADVDDQKRVLRWITGSDRVPAAGVKSLVLKIQCLGEDEKRLPQCRTCFNTLQLWKYKSRRTFVNKFWYAVVQSGQGFGLK